MDLPSKLTLEIVTPVTQLFSGEVDRVEIPGREGYMGILPGHAPLLSELKIGVITLVREGKEEKMVCGWGFAEILPDRVSILAEIAESPEQINLEEAREDQEQAEQVLQGRAASDVDYDAVLEKLNLATVRLEVGSGE